MTLSTLEKTASPISVETPAEMKSVLHVGCGLKGRSQLPTMFNNKVSWQEIRFDINPDVEPDIIGSMTDMHAIDDASVDAIYSSHNLEHLDMADVFKALAEFKRVLKKDGFVLLTCPDLQTVAEFIAQDKLLDPLYQSDAGAISPFDIVYGYRKFTSGNPFMAHRSGFTLKSLMAIFNEAGFATILGLRHTKAYELWALAFISKQSEALAKACFKEALAGKV